MSKQLHAVSARDAEARRIAQFAAAGGFAIEVTAGGIRLRDDVPISLELTDLGHLALVDDDAPIPLTVAS